MDNNALALTVQERERRDELEVVIRSGLKTFYEVGNALAEIREKRLYRETHSSFESYCQEVWEISRRHANRLIGSAGVIENLTKGPMGPTEKLPTSERVARPLTKLPPEQQREVWQEVVAKEEPVTAKRVERVLSVRQRAQAAVAGTSIKNPYAAIGVLVNLHQQHGEEAFVGILALVASGRYDTPQKAYLAYRLGARPESSAGIPVQRQAVPKVRVEDRPVCPCCGQEIRR
jgi:hypothetical protein